MKTRDPFESEILGAYEKGELKSIGLSKAELKTFRDSCSGDAYQEPAGKYPTLIP